MISILMITIDRYKITSESLIKNLAGLDYPDYELLICDNGSKDKKIIDWVSKLPNLSYHRINIANEGVASSFNQLMIRAKGDYICLLGNDILMPNKWGGEMVRYAQKVKKSGLIGIKCTAPIPPIATKDNIHAHYLDPINNRVFGTTLFRKEVIEEVGGYCQRYCPYGLEDSDLNERVNIAGFQSLYVPNMVSQHQCDDVGEDSKYRKIKDISLAKNTEIFGERVRGFKKNGYYEPFPKKIDQIIF